MMHYSGNMTTYIVIGCVLVSDVTSSRHSVAIKFDIDTPGFARCCLRNTVRASWAPKGPETSDRISSLDCPSNLIKRSLNSIIYHFVIAPAVDFFFAF